MMTHGERWLAKAHARLAGWCKTRGWQCSSPFPTASSQHEVFIRDRLGRTASVAFNMHADEARLVDDSGLQMDFDAVTFDHLITPYGLAGKPKHSKKQLDLFA